MLLRRPVSAAYLGCFTHFSIIFFLIFLFLLIFSIHSLEFYFFTGEHEAFFSLPFSVFHFAGYFLLFFFYFILFSFVRTGFFLILFLSFTLMHCLLRVAQHKWDNVGLRKVIIFCTCRIAWLCQRLSFTGNLCAVMKLFFAYFLFLFCSALLSLFFAIFLNVYLLRSLENIKQHNLMLPLTIVVFGVVKLS